MTDGDWHRSRCMREPPPPTRIFQKARRGPFHLAAVLAAICLTHTPDVALAASDATTLVRQALTAETRGRLAESAQLCDKALTVSPGSPECLLLLGRVHARMGNLDLAEKHYMTFLATAPSGERAAQARFGLMSVREAKGEKLAKQAVGAAESQRFREAAQLYRKARVLQPGHFDYLFAEALAQEQLPDRSSALALFEQYLRDAPADTPEHSQAQAHVSRLTASTLPLGDTVKSSSRAKKGLGWTLVAVGAASIAASGAMALWASSERSALDAQLKPSASSGLVESISYDDARTRAAQVGDHRMIAGIVGSIGAVAAITGCILVIRGGGSSNAALVPQDRGAALLVQF